MSEVVAVADTIPLQPTANSTLQPTLPPAITEEVPAHTGGVEEAKDNDVADAAAPEEGIPGSATKLTTVLNGIVDEEPRLKVSRTIVNGKVKIKLTGTKDLLLLKEGDEFEVDTSTRHCRILPGIIAFPLVVSCRCFWKCRKLLPRRAWCRCKGQMS